MGEQKDKYPGLQSVLQGRFIIGEVQEENEFYFSYSGFDMREGKAVQILESHMSELELEDSDVITDSTAKELFTEYQKAHPYVTCNIKERFLESGTFYVIISTEILLSATENKKPAATGEVNDNKSKKKSKNTIILLVVVCGVAGVLISLFFHNKQTTNKNASYQTEGKGTTVESELKSVGTNNYSDIVPDVLGREIYEGLLKLRDAGFSALEQYEHSRTVADGIIISQSPEAGTVMERNGNELLKIDLTVSLGLGTEHAIKSGDTEDLPFWVTGTYVINGVEINMPCTCKQLEATGLILDYEDENLEECQNGMFDILYQGEKCGYGWVWNNKTGIQNAEECLVSLIHIYKDTVPFLLPGGVGFGSDLDDFKAVYEDAYVVNPGEYESYFVGFERFENNLEVWFDKEQIIEEIGVNIN